jgi:hypothetical protein
MPENLSGSERKLLNRYRAIKTLFYEAIDKENLILQQSAFYIILVILGIYGLIFAHQASEPVEKLMSDAVIAIWYVLHIIGPISSLYGRSLLGGANAILGTRLQLIGDLMVFVGISIFIVCNFIVYDWGRAYYGLFFVIFGLMGVILFLFRDIRRIIQIEKAYREVKHIVGEDD